MILTKFLKMMGVKEMTLSKSQKDSLKNYNHALVTKEDLHPIWTYGISEKLRAQLDIVKRHDVPFCMLCKKFGGDLFGKCSGLKLEKEEPKVEAIKMGFMVDTDEAQHWIDAERFDLMGDWHRLFKGVKLVAVFHVKEVNYIKQMEQPHIVLGRNINGNHI